MTHTNIDGVLFNSDATPSGPCHIAAAVAAEIQARAALGLRKYGVTVADAPLSRAQWLQHAYEEACDLAVYLRRLIEMEREEPRDYRADAEWMATYILGRLPDDNTMTPGAIADYERQLEERVDSVAARIGKP